MNLCWVASSKLAKKPPAALTSRLEHKKSEAEQPAINFDNYCHIVHDLPTGIASIVNSYNPDLSLTCSPLTSSSLTNSGAHSLAWSPDGLQLAVATDTAVELWDAAQRTCRHSLYNDHSDKLMSMTWSPNGKYIAALTCIKLYVWDAATQKSIADFNTVRNLSLSRRALCWSPDSSKISFSTTGSMAEHVFVIYDLTTKQSIGESEKYRHIAHSLIPKNTGHWSVIRQIAWAPNDSYVATCSNDGYIKLWLTHALTRNKNFPLHADLPAQHDPYQRGLASIAWSPDSTKIASGSLHNGITIWDVATQAKLATIPSGQFVNATVWSPDGLKILAGSENNDSLEIYDGQSYQQLATACPQTQDYNPLRTMVLSPDSMTIATAHKNNIMIWQPSQTAQAIINQAVQLGTQKHLTLNLQRASVITGLAATAIYTLKKRPKAALASLLGTCCGWFAAPKIAQWWVKK